MDENEFKSLLFSAVQHHNDTLLEDLLADGNGAHLLDLPGHDGNTLLHSAVIEGDLACISFLLKNGTDPNVFDVNRARTPLHLAVELNLIEVVKTFLELEHVNLDLRDDRNLKCHEIAQYCDNQDLAELILARQEEIEQIRNDFYSVMNQACNNNDAKLVKILLERFEQQIVDKLPKGWSMNPAGKSFVRTSLKEMINWSSSSWNDVTLLFKSASKGHTDICKILIEFGATAKCNEDTNYSPLYVAAYGGYTSTVRLLLDYFPWLVQEVTIEKWTVLHACCLQGHSETAKLILHYQYPGDFERRYVSRSGLYEYKFAFNLNAQDAAGQTVIYLAVSANNESLLDALLQFNIEANCIDQQPTTTNNRDSHLAQDESVMNVNRRARIIPDRPKIKSRPDQELVSKNSDQPNTQLDKILRQLQRLKSKDSVRNTDDHEYPQDSYNRRHMDVLRHSLSGVRGITCIKLKDSDKYLICPFEMDTYCDYNSKTALHLAICQQYHNIATTLLVNGANPNLPILFRDSISKQPSTDITANISPTATGDIGLNWLRSSKSTCLKEACRLNDETMCEILIRYGARDNQDNMALQVAALNKNSSMISMFLSLKSNLDPEYKINRKCNVEFSSRYKQTSQQQRLASALTITTTFSSMFPSTPVTIDWQNLRCIKQIDPQWLIDASLQHNKRLRHPTNSLMAITRLDLSCNNLKSVHPVIFRLPSLRELNLSSNRLESLIEISHHSSKLLRKSSNDDDTAITSTALTPTSKLIESHRIAMRRSKSSNFAGVHLESSNLIDLNEPQEWDLPCLETLDLHDNLLIALPDCLFELPRLRELDVSSNQLRQLPWAMWIGPALKEIMASGNLLDDLPRAPPLSHRISSASFASGQNPLVESRLQSSVNNSPSEERLSSLTHSDLSTENQSLSGDGQRIISLHVDKLIEDLHIIQSKIELQPGKVPHSNYWSKKIDLVDSYHDEGRGSNHKNAIDESSDPEADGTGDVQIFSKLNYLNLSNNSFACIPPVLACIAVELTRLNLSHNCLTTLGDISLYPANLKNLDLSNNQISSWFQQNQLDDDTKHCFTENVLIKARNSPINSKLSPSPASTRFHHQRGYGVLHCVHKMHQRLDNLKSLNLSRNSLKTIDLYNLLSTRAVAGSRNSIGSLNIPSNTRDSFLSGSSGVTSPSPMSKSQLLFPNITALDLSFNHIQSVPESVSDARDLSVLNLSGNSMISSLPAELGLATKLWNLGVNGCNLGDPLKSIIESKSYKTMDIIGYLRSILEEAKPYARMKLMLVGLQGIGKTSLLEQMRHEGSTGNTRRRAPEHWTRRMGHTSRSNLRNQKGVTLSTVGVDIHDWIYQKKVPRNHGANHGPVSFSTWDFGGQEEFYATHRYFLSRRSMYLVVWRMTDGYNGITGIQQWLVNIQSRAPNSPVIIVGTHEDMIEGGERGTRVRELQAEVYRRFINVSDHDKCGLPHVEDSIVVSTKTKLNIRNLCNRIYDIVFALRCPGSTERLLEQKIPATYLYLEEIISSLVHDRQLKKREPVMAYVEYRRVCSEQLKAKYNKHFRDLEPLNSREINYNSELQQATRFLHENGVLLHYEDANLRDLYFLDPQWLCDILSHVVTIREINPHVKNGLMKIDDLNHLFKTMDVNVSGGVQSYVVNLLNKFEVALTWNSQYLLIPSLLPRDVNSLCASESTSDARLKLTTHTNEKFQMKVAPRMRGRSAVRRPIDSSQATNRAALAQSIVRATSIDPSRRKLLAEGTAQDKQREFKYFYDFEYIPEGGIVRLVLLRYLPAGFLARLQSGLLSDPAFDDICDDLQFDLLNKLVAEGNETLEELVALLGNRPGWICWKSGIRLNLQKESTINSRNDEGLLASPCLLSLQEYSSMSKEFSLDKLNLQIECVEINQDPKQTEGNSLMSNKNRTDQMSSAGGVEITGSKWTKFDQSSYSNVIMIVVPNSRLRITSKEDRSVTYTVEFKHQNIARLLSKAVDHIDDLLEDWYPSLGARFAHTLGGSYLVTRIVLCQVCASKLLSDAGAHLDQRHNHRHRPRAQRDSSRENNIGLKLSATNSAVDRRAPSQVAMDALETHINDIHCFYVEHCILNAFNLSSSSIDNNGALKKSKFNLSHLTSPKPNNNISSPSDRLGNLYCPRHGLIPLTSVAPDIIFDDVIDSLKIDNEQIERCKLIGRGALGFVFKGSVHSNVFPLNQLGQSNQEVALKLLQPADPGPDADQSDLAAYNSARNNWLREPFQSACRSYCSARHEINILQSLCHPNIVQFIGICTRPLAIVLELAPLGSLEEVFKNYKRAGARINKYSAQRSILQIARALEFLHQHRIIYRDLKTENVLVWSYPAPHSRSSTPIELKLADYGISRQALSTGIWKGFAGTINFLAPEILRHNGDEEYTEKVDCYSFGMLMYELLTLRPPFKQQQQQAGPLGLGVGNAGGDGASKQRSYLCELGTRPLLTMRDLIYPDYITDLMCVCWSQEPHDRPTASQIVSIASAPEFMQVQDTIELAGPNSMIGSSHQGFACSIYHEQSEQLDLWWLPNDAKCQWMVASSQLGKWTRTQALSIESPEVEVVHTAQFTASCLVEDSIWLFDSQQSLIHILPAGPVPINQDDLQQTINHPKSTLQGLGSPDLADYSSRQQQEQTDTESLTIRSFPIDLTHSAEDAGFKSDKSNLGQTIVKQMIFAQKIRSLVLLTQDGQLWICQLGKKMACHQLENSSIRFNCMAAYEKVIPGELAEDIKDDLNQDDSSSQPGGNFKLYCGQSNGISCLEISDEALVCRQSILPLASKMLDIGGEQIVEANQTTEVGSIVVSHEHLWTAAGCTVHLWNRQEKLVIRKLDCWKLVPCSESLESINIEQYYQQAKSSRITSLAQMRNQLFVGTSHGCFIVIEASSLKPIIVFRPYESDLMIIKPMTCPSVKVINHSSSTVASTQRTADDLNATDDGFTTLALHNQLITIGYGYRDLMCRYINSLQADKQPGKNNPSEINDKFSEQKIVATILSAECNYNL